MTPRTLRRLERALSIATVISTVVFVLGLHRLAQLEHRLPPPVPWVRLRIDYGTPGPYFLGLRLGPRYRTQRLCLRSLPSSGYETLGHTTTYWQFECARL